MKRMSPYKHHTSPQSPEVGFAMRLGRASHSLPTFNDVVKRNDIFQHYLSQLSNELFNKYYIAKLASRDCIVSRISVTLHEIDALEKMKDFLVESQKQEKEQLAAASEELELFVKEAKALQQQCHIQGMMWCTRMTEDERSEDEKDDSQL
ncbi:hypothetical protein EDD16DRAFT_1525912 [Pisolithus croceorrhizus]|nr:hypothetical protein EDD16DRAFT_1525912 [Pisolithus croceorrhizus]